MFIVKISICLIDGILELYHFRLPVFETQRSLFIVLLLLPGYSEYQLADGLSSKCFVVHWDVLCLIF